MKVNKYINKRNILFIYILIFIFIFIFIHNISYKSSDKYIDYSNQYNNTELIDEDRSYFIKRTPDSDKLYNVYKPDYGYETIDLSEWEKDDVNTLKQYLTDIINILFVDEEFILNVNETDINYFYDTYRVNEDYIHLDFEYPSLFENERFRLDINTNDNSITYYHYM